MTVFNEKLQKIFVKNFSKIAIVVILVYVIAFSNSFRNTISFEKNHSNEPKKFIKSFQTSQTNVKLKIVIPFHIKQLDRVYDNINKWEKFKPCDSNNSDNEIELIYYVGYSESEQTILNDLNKKLPPVIECFSQKHVVLYKYKNSNEDQHVKGSRLMFEHMLKRQDVKFKNTSFTFYMEPDVRPIKSNWLNGLIEEIGNGNFWVKGSCFRGDINKFMKNDPYIPNYLHINGNAIYNIGSDDFNYFYFNVLRPYVMKKNGDSKNAYDTDFFEFFFDKDNYETTRNVVNKFHFSDFIQNFWQTEFKVNEMANKFLNTYFIHGGSPIY